MNDPLYYVLEERPGPGRFRSWGQVVRLVIAVAAFGLLVGAAVWELVMW
jgi:hypothetical protein